jgi:hypothetical protein
MADPSRALSDVLQSLAESKRPFDKSHFVELLRQRRFDEGLSVLYQLREHSPDNASIARGIQLLKAKLLQDQLERLGDLDLVPRLRAVSPSTLGDDVASVLRLVDDISCTGDILECSRLGRLATARALVQLVDAGCIALLSRERPQLHLIRPPPSEPSPPSGDAAPPGVAEPAPDFDALFRSGTERYLARDYAEAERLFGCCHALRPEDRRVLHNIERLAKRKRES